jgi:hypothetical protein
VNRNRNVVLATAVVILLFSFVSLDILVREGDGGGDDSRREGLAHQAGQQDGSTSPRSELAPTSAPTDDSAPSSSPVPAPRPRAASDLVPPTGPLVSRPLPATASRHGGVVRGYPKALLQVVPGAAVRSTSVSSSGATEQVSLSAVTDRSPEAVAAYYRLSLGRFGFTDTLSRSAGETVGWGFRRGRDTVVLTTTPRDGGRCSFLLLAVLHASAD